MAQNRTSKGFEQKERYTQNVKEHQESSVVMKSRSLYRDFFIDTKPVSSLLFAGAIQWFYFATFF